jgi:hypothetical protein
VTCIESCCPFFVRPQPLAVFGQLNLKDGKFVVIANYPKTKINAACLIFAGARVFVAVARVNVAVASVNVAGARVFVAVVRVFVAVVRVIRADAGVNVAVASVNVAVVKVNLAVVKVNVADVKVFVADVNVNRAVSKENVANVGGKFILVKNGVVCGKIDINFDFFSLRSLHLCPYGGKYYFRR